MLSGLRSSIARQLAVVLATATLVGGCGGNPPVTGTGSPAGATSSPTDGSSAPTSGTQASPMTADQATATYGYAPMPVAGVTYQPDVVVVQGGAAAIRSASADGLVWTIDRNAAGAADLAVDKVMLLTSSATGRVVAITDVGDTRVVTLAPVDLTDIISDGTFNLDQAIDGDLLGYQLVPDLPAQLIIPAGGPAESPQASPTSVFSQSEPIAQNGYWDLQAPLVRLRPRALNAASSGTLPPALQPRQCAEISVGSWSMKPCADKGKVSLGIDYKFGGGGAKPGLKVGLVFSIATNNLHMRSSGSISGGQMNGATAVVDGLQGVDVEVAAGAANGLSDNDKVKIEVPYEIDAPIPPSPETLGLPINIKIEFKYIVETAFSSKNATLTATGNYTLTGPLGLDGGNVVTPTGGVAQSLVDSLAGIGIGVSGFVFVAKVKVQAGLGVPAATAGPYVTLTATVGLTLGSSIGIVQCRLTNWALKGGVGFGITITQDAIAALLEKLPIPKSKLKTETEKSIDIMKKDDAQPDVAACKP